VQDLYRKPSGLLPKGGGRAPRSFEAFEGRAHRSNRGMPKVDAPAAAPLASATPPPRVRHRSSRLRCCVVRDAGSISARSFSVSFLGGGGGSTRTVEG
jgi:hypothetical protein